MAYATIVGGKHTTMAWLLEERQQGQRIYWPATMNFVTALAVFAIYVPFFKKEVFNCDSRGVLTSLF
jgi:hypothetical protein